MRSLTSLNMSGCKNLKMLSQTLTSLTRLRVLDLSGCAKLKHPHPTLKAGLPLFQGKNIATPNEFRVRHSAD